MSMNQSSTQTPKRGVFIALEGIDGSGKTTQARLLADFLEEHGYKTVVLFEPTNGAYGTQLREQAKSGRVSPEEEFRLFLLDRQEDAENNILPALRKGKIVIIDRYMYSSMAYQGARGLDPEMIRKENEQVAPRADLVIYLRITVDISGERITRNRNDSLDHFEHAEYQKKVADIYDAMSENLHEFRTIDATTDILTVHHKVRTCALAVIQKFRNQTSRLQ